MAHDGDWRVQCERQVIQCRNKLYQSIRSYFLKQNVLEVETPVLSRFANTDVATESFISQPLTQYLQESYLRTSPEFFHKRLLASGWGDIFEIGKVFRHNESSGIHNPEFSLLEWYRLQFEMCDMMDDVQRLIEYLCDDFEFKRPVFERFNYSALFRSIVNIDPLSSHEQELNQLCRKYGYRGGFLDKSQCLDFIFSCVIQPELSESQCIFIHHFPASQAALSQIDSENPMQALRFELIWRNKELANGYQELTCPQEQSCRFDNDNNLRGERGQNQMPKDNYLLAALEFGLPPCSGVAVGLDRLLMCLLGIKDISQVVTFSARNA